jgi:uncharacterized membrane protein YdcZ (DUF606 family)
MNYINVLIGIAILGVIFWFANIILVPFRSERSNYRNWWFFAAGAFGMWIVNIVMEVLE